MKIRHQAAKYELLPTANQGIFDEIGRLFQC